MILQSHPTRSRAMARSRRCERGRSSYLQSNCAWVQPLVSNCGVSAVSLLHGSPKSLVTNAFDVAEFAVDDIRDIEW
jgi:hypothetical protein